MFGHVAVMSGSRVAINLGNPAGVAVAAIAGAVAIADVAEPSACHVCTFVQLRRCVWLTLRCIQILPCIRVIGIIRLLVCMVVVCRCVVCRRVVLIRVWIRLSLTFVALWKDHSFIFQNAEVTQCRITKAQWAMARAMAT